MTTEDLAEIATRYQHSKTETESRWSSAGKALGEEWACSIATYEEMKNLWERFEGGLSDLLPTLDNSNYRLVYETIRPESDSSWDREQFWEQEVGATGYPNDAIVKGFVVGALSIWSAVKDKIDA
jgi:hypothetical protein